MLLRIYVCTYIYVYIHNQVHLLYKRYSVEALQLHSNTQSQWSSGSTVCFQLHNLHFVSTTANLADCLTREGMNLKNIEIKELPILHSKAKSPLFRFYFNFFWGSLLAKEIYIFEINKKNRLFIHNMTYLKKRRFLLSEEQFFKFFNNRFSQKSFKILEHAF